MSWSNSWRKAVRRMVEISSLDSYIEMKANFKFEHESGGLYVHS